MYEVYLILIWDIVKLYFSLAILSLLNLSTLGIKTSMFEKVGGCRCRSEQASLMHTQIKLDKVKPFRVLVTCIADSQLTTLCLIPEVKTDW